MGIDRRGDFAGAPPDGEDQGLKMSQGSWLRIRRSGGCHDLGRWDQGRNKQAGLAARTLGRDRPPWIVLGP